MNIIFDIIGSILFTGILIVTILTINSNMVVGNYKSISTYEIQTQAVQLGRIMEYDLYKIGFNVSGNRVIAADTGFLQFRSDLANNGAIQTVTYQLGDLIAASSNPRDRQLSRMVDGSTLFISYNATRFCLTYYDSAMTRLPTPLSAANILKLRTVNVALTLETPDPVDVVQRGAGTDSLFTGAYYEKMISARNLVYY